MTFLIMLSKFKITCFVPDKLVIISTENVLFFETVD